MKTFLAIALLSLTLNLVSGYEYSEVEDRGMMNISETKKCYVYGQCQEYSLDFKETEDPEGCHKFCSKNNECNWWSWEPVECSSGLCILFANCTDGTDPPDVEACGDCISGEKLCPARECHGAFKCKGDFVDSFAIATLEECIEKCNQVVDCQWFTLEKKNDHCILYEECDDQFDCETCATGEKKCANGYKGTTPAPAVSQGPNNNQGTTKAPDVTTYPPFPPPYSPCEDQGSQTCEGDGCWVCDMNWTLEGEDAAGCTTSGQRMMCGNNWRVFGETFPLRRVFHCDNLKQPASTPPVWQSTYYFEICTGNYASYTAENGEIL